MPAAPNPDLLAHVLEGRFYRPLIDGPDVSMHRAAWRRFFGELAATSPPDKETAERFHLKWHESHHFIRELVDDDDLFIEAAEAWLPPYRGPGLVLFRGENIDRLERGSIGSAWSDKEETAETFARGLNAVGKGGVILRADVPAEAIVAGPTDHSANWLRESEFTVDVRRLVAIERLREFGPPQL